MKKLVTLFIFAISQPVFAMGNLHTPFKGAMTTDTTPITVEIGNYEYAIPANYFDMQPYTDCNMSDVAFIGLVPSFEGRSKENTKEFSPYNHKHNRIVRGLIKADPQRRERAADSLKGWHSINKKESEKSYKHMKYLGVVEIRI